MKDSLHFILLRPIESMVSGCVFRAQKDQGLLRKEQAVGWSANVLPSPADRLAGNRRLS